jgi:hypothetical protein
MKKSKFLPFIFLIVSRLNKDIRFTVRHNFLSRKLLFLYETAC